MHISRTHILAMVLCMIAVFNDVQKRDRFAFAIDNLSRAMKQAYATVNDSQANVEVLTYQANGDVKAKKFLYTFKRPHWFRLDFEVPHPGWILVYPGRNGKVVIRPSGLVSFLRFRFDPDSSWIKDESGQRIDQTDLGLLIDNISRSLTDRRRGPLEVKEQDGRILIRVLAENHFREGAVTRYKFLIDKASWLPVGIQESRPDGRLERKVFLRNLRTNLGVSQGFFEIGG